MFVIFHFPSNIFGLFLLVFTLPGCDGLWFLPQKVLTAFQDKTLGRGKVYC